MQELEQEENLTAENEGSHFSILRTQGQILSFWKKKKFSSRKIKKQREDVLRKQKQNWKILERQKRIFCNR